MNGLLQDDLEQPACPTNAAEFFLENTRPRPESPEIRHLLAPLEGAPFPRTLVR